VASGALTVWTGPDKVTLRSGDYYLIPMHVPHTILAGPEDAPRPPHQHTGRIRRAQSSASSSARREPSPPTSASTIAPDTRRCGTVPG